jgi:hypothetical protein
MSFPLAESSFDCLGFFGYSTESKNYKNSRSCFKKPSSVLALLTKRIN